MSSVAKTHGQARTRHRCCASVTNLGRISASSDNVFGEAGAEYPLAEVTGSVDEGYVATLTVGISV